MRNFNVQLRALCLVGLAWCWVACACAASAVPGKAPQAPAQALQELLYQPVGPHAADAFHWAQACLPLGRAGEAADLRNFLLQAWLTELETGQPTLSLTVEAATALGG